MHLKSSPSFLSLMNFDRTKNSPTKKLCYWSITIPFACYPRRCTCWLIVKWKSWLSLPTQATSFRALTWVCSVPPKRKCRTGFGWRVMRRHGVQKSDLSCNEADTSGKYCAKCIHTAWSSIYYRDKSVHPALRWATVPTRCGFHLTLGMRSSPWKFIAKKTKCNIWLGQSYDSPRLK
jgi:hypothetical protein